VHESLGAELLGGPGDGVAAGDEVGVDGQIGGLLDHQGILRRQGGQQDDVGALGPDPLVGFRDAGEGVAGHHHLHEGVVGQGDEVGDHRLLLGHEIVRVGDVPDHPPVAHRSVLLDQLLRPAQIILGLGHRLGAYTDVELGRRREYRSAGECERQAGKQYCSFREKLHETSF